MSKIETGKQDLIGTYIQAFLEKTFKKDLMGLY